VPHAPATPRTRARALAAAVGLAVLAALAGCGSERASLPRPRGILLVVLDTLRADGLSLYGNPRQTSPALDALAARSVVFENAVSHAPWTLPSFVGLLSGRYPSSSVFSEGTLHTSLVEALRTAGYRTAAFTEGGYVSRHFALDRGFESFWEEEGKTFLARPGTPRGAGSVERTFDAAIAWLHEPRSEPFFLLVHTYEIHTPYRQREYAEELPRGRLGPTYEERDRQAVRSGRLSVGPVERAYVRALYDGGVRAVDRQVERLLRAVEETGRADDTLVVVTSDHGEDLGGRSPRALGDHGHQLYDELLRVPLVVRLPGAPWPAGRVDTQVRLVDVVPTLLELAGAPVPAGLAGSSLVPVLEGRERSPRLAYAELRRSPWNEHPRTAVRDGRYKLIANLLPRAPGWPEIEFYDVGADPGEQENLIGIRSDALDRLAGSLEAQRRALHGDGTLAMPEEGLAPPELRRQLEALGYVDAHP
jgi:arylsulfatase A-like enzyme